MNPCLSALLNLTLNSACLHTDLHDIGMALREEIPYSTELSWPTGIHISDIDEPLQDYCFSCGRVKGIIPGGKIRSTCNDCDSSHRNTTMYKTKLYTLVPITGYSESMLEYLLLKQLQHYPPLGLRYVHDHPQLQQEN